MQKYITLTNNDLLQITQILFIESKLFNRPCNEFLKQFCKQKPCTIPRSNPPFFGFKSIFWDSPLLPINVAYTCFERCFKICQQRTSNVLPFA